MSQAPMPTPLNYGTPGPKRPGGLTALAVLNFVFGGLGALGILAGFIALAAWEAARKQNVQLPSSAIMAIILLVGLVGVILEIASGVGYLGQKKFLGYTLGNAFAIFGVISNLLSIILIGFGFMSLLGFVYPAITLALLNGPFKNSFPNP